MGAALAVDALELAAAGQPAALSARAVGHRLGGEPLAALGAAALEKRTAGAGAHARAEPVGAGALALLWLVGALHGCARARVQDRRRDAFPAFCGPPPGVPRPRRSFRRCTLARPRAAGARFVPLGPSSVKTDRRAPEEGRDRPCPHSQTRFGTPSAASSAGRRPISSSTSGSSRSSWRPSGTPPSTSARPSTSAPRSPSATCRCCAARPPSASTRARRGGRRRGLGAAAGGRGARTGAPRRPARHRERRHRDRLNPKYTFDQFVIGAGNRLRPRGRAGRRRAARPVVQPALPARLARHRQDAPPPRHRQLRRALRLRAHGALRDDRGVHVRVRRGRAAQVHRRLQAALPRRRRGADRRRPVPRRPRTRRARSSSTRSTRCSTPAASS